jgi:hypothetical protein
LLSQCPPTGAKPAPAPFDAAPRGANAQAGVSGYAPQGARKDGFGRFALLPEAHLTEKSPLVTHANRLRLFREWGTHWDLSRPVLLEKSPPNMMWMRFLQVRAPLPRTSSRELALAATLSTSTLHSVEIGALQLVHVSEHTLAVCAVRVLARQSSTRLLHRPRLGLAMQRQMTASSASPIVADC